MALFKPCLINKSQLDSYPISSGQYIVCPDTCEIFVDVSSGNRKQLSGKIQSVAIGDVVQQITATGQVNIDAPIVSGTAAHWSSNRNFIPYKG